MAEMWQELDSSISLVGMAQRELVELDPNNELLQYGSPTTDEALLDRFWPTESRGRPWREEPDRATRFAVALFEYYKALDAEVTRIKGGAPQPS